MPQEMNIQWFPGHMTKARREMADSAKLVDLVCEIADARIPVSSRNPDLGEIIGPKPRIIVLNRVDQADPALTALWSKKLRGDGAAVIEADCKSGAGVAAFIPAVRAALKEKTDAYAAKGQPGRMLRVLVAGIPNVGKSSFINRLAKRKAAETSDRPGVTRGKQWIKIDRGLELMDTPGILWPRFDNQTVGENLAFTGAVKDDVLDTEALASNLMSRLASQYPKSLAARYKIEPAEGESGYDLLIRAAKKRGFLVSGGEANTERMAAVLLDEFRAGLLGRITLERPED